MTARLERRNHGRGHSYRLDGAKVLGVTTVLQALAKPALVEWSGNTTAEYAVDRWDELGALPPSKRLAALKGARWESKTAAALRGTEIHRLGERVSHGEKVDAGVHQGEVEAYARFLDRWDFQMIATETPVAHTRFRYAGTADAWAWIGAREERALVDIKSGRGIFDEVALQLSAYRFCEIWQPEGPDSEQPLPPVDAVYVAHVLPDDVRLVPVEADEGTFRQFRYLMELTRWQGDGPYVGAAVDDPILTAPQETA